MSKSFEIVAGDLAVRDRRLATVSGRDKLVQDLRLRVLEHLGGDPSNPALGTSFDSDRFLGTTFAESLSDDARSELQRVLEGYQREQLGRIREETILYAGQTTLEEGETIRSIDALEVAFQGTTITLRATVTTLDGSSVAVVAPLRVED